LKEKITMAFLLHQNVCFQFIFSSNFFLCCILTRGWL
jgi:hypothetical protein